MSRPLLPKLWDYCCLDPDPQKLKGFCGKFPQDEVVEASGCSIPFADCSFDLCIMVAVSHHLTVKELDSSLAEIKRVLRPQGKLMLIDAVLNPKNIRGCILWSVDRGIFPKRESGLARHLARHFSIERRLGWRVLHEYALFWCSKCRPH